MRMVLAVVVSAACVALAPGHAQEAAQQPPVFRSGVDLMTVDVSVLDGRGTPIEGLTAADFRVTVNGGPRRVLWADYVPHRQAPLEGADAAQSFSSNERVNPGRVVMIAVDQLHIRRVEGRAALRAAASFVDSLAPSDRVAAAPLNHGGSVEFTTDHAAVKRYLHNLTGEASMMPAHFSVGLSESLQIADGSRTILDMVVRRECGQSLGRFENLARAAENDGLRDPCPVQVEQESRAFAQQARTEARLSLTALERLVARLGEIEGQKTLVLVSEGLVAEPQLFDLGALGALAQAARVTVYVLQLDVPLVDAAESKASPTMHADRLVRSDGLSRLAGAARGALFTLVGADPYPFQRILRELSGYYLVAFEAADSDRDGRMHRVSVSTRAPGATVRARTAFTIPPKLTPAQTGSTLERLLRSPRLSTELPLRVAAYSFRHDDGKALRVVLTAETDVAGAGRDVTMAYVLVNDAGVIVASGAGATETGRYSVAVNAPPGRYMLKAAAVEPGGRQGSVERRFNARLGAAGPVTLSDLVVGDASAAGEATPRPAVARAAGDRVVVYFEAYAPDGWTPPPSIVFELTGANAERPAASAPGAFRAAGEGRWIARAEIPVAALAPGPYIAAAVVPVTGGDPIRLTRSLVLAAPPTR